MQSMQRFKFWLIFNTRIASNFVLHTTYEMLDSTSEGLNSVKRQIAELLLEKKMVHAEQPENRAAYAF